MSDQQLNLFDSFNDPIIPSETFDEVESDEVEYKSAKLGFPDDFWKTYSAFANTLGGIIVLGVKEKKNTFKIEGLTEDLIIKYQKDFWSTINNRNKISSCLLSNNDVKVFSSEDKKLLAFRILPASRTQKPVYLNNNPFQNTYKRNYEGDYKCTDEEVRRMLADADLSFRPDSRILEGYSIDDFDMVSVRQYRQIFSSVRPTHNWLTLLDKELLIQLGAYRVERRTKIEGPTLAGILMFGKSISVTDEECCPNFFPDYREILSDNPEERWSDRIFPDGTWEANLFQFYRMVWPKLSSRLPKPFQLIKGQRQDETPAHTALREAFVNALIHADYSAPGNVIIESKPDIFKFTNPGTLLVSLSQYYAGGISECRNTSLQKMFLMIGSAEKAGSGVSKILSGWEYAHWRTPYLAIESGPDRLILTLPMFSILPEETLNELRKLFGENVDTLGKDELTILAACHIEGEITNRRLQYILNLHKTDITKILQELCKLRYLVSDNRSRWTTYHLNTDFNDLNLDSNTANLDSNTANLDSNTANLDSNTANLDSNTANLDSNSIHISKKMTREQMYLLIRSLCQKDYLSAEEISEKVNRSIRYLKNEILPAMLSGGKLIRLYPDNPTHPNQKFKAT